MSVKRQRKPDRSRRSRGVSRGFRADGAATRASILQVAGRLFAERGYADTTSKAICKAARTNIAAVNYHFKDKAELYAEVIRGIEAEVAAIVPTGEALAGRGEERFRKCVRHIALAMLGRGQPPWERVLMARELAWPSRQMEALLDNVGGRINTVMAEVIGELTGRPRTDKVVGYLIASVMGQCVYFLQHQTLLRRLYPQFKRDPSPESIAEHIVEFSLAGVRAFAK